MVERKEDPKAQYCYNDKNATMIYLAFKSAMVGKTARNVERENTLSRQHLGRLAASKLKVTARSTFSREDDQQYKVSLVQHRPRSKGSNVRSFQSLVPRISARDNMIRLGR